MIKSFPRFVRKPTKEQHLIMSGEGNDSSSGSSGQRKRPGESMEGEKNDEAQEGGKGKKQQKVSSCSGEGKDGGMELPGVCCLCPCLLQIGQSGCFILTAMVA